MKTWTAITQKSIEHYLLPLQLEALRQHSDPLDEIIADTVAAVRAEVHSNPNNPCCTDPSLIPKELMRATCHLIIEALQSRIPNMKLSDDQIRNANNARMLLCRIARREVSLIALNKIHELTKVAEVAFKRQRQATHQTLQGL